MNLTLVLFLIGILGFVFNRKNIILMLISIEIMLLAITFLILVSSINLDDIIGQVYAIYIIVVAGAESAIGLAILVAFYRLNFFPQNKKIKKSYSSPILREKYRKHPSRVRRFNNLIEVRYYSNKANKLDNNSRSEFIKGLIDARGSFVVTVLKNDRYKIGWIVQVGFQIKLHEKDRPLLLSIQEYFGRIGYISNINNKSTVKFRVCDTNSLLYIIIPYFYEHSLNSNKMDDFLLFKDIVKLKSKNQHKNSGGLTSILGYVAALNLGLPKKLKNHFPLIEPAAKKKYIPKKIEDLTSGWVTGFASGGSNFFLAVQKDKSITLRFSIASQDPGDLLLLNKIALYFKCGHISKNKEVCEFAVTKVRDILNIIIPFFDTHKIQGIKYNDYIKFKEAANIIKNKEHLGANASEGLEKIMELKNSMDKNI